MPMMPAADLLGRIVPGEAADSACDLRPLLRQGLMQRLKMIMLLIRAAPQRVDDPARLAALIEQVLAAAPAWQERFFDDPEVAAWLIRQPLNPATPAPPFRAPDLQALIARQAPSAEAMTAYPSFHFDALPPHLAEVLTTAAATDGLDIALVRPIAAEQARLAGAFAAGVSVLSSLWPGMAAAVRQHVTTVIFNHGSTTTSHRYFAGSLVLAVPELERPVLGARHSLGETLCHETVHQMLYCLQEQGPLILPPAGSRFASPWSGAVRSLLLAAHIAPVNFAVMEYLHRLRLRRQADDAALAGRLRGLLDGMDRFFGEGIGRPYLTATGRALHDQVEAAIHRRRADYLAG